MASDVPIYTGPWVPDAYERFAVLGMTGSGKSYLLKQWVAYLMGQQQAVVVIDVADEYSRAGKARPGQPTFVRGPLTQRMTIPEFRAALRHDTAFLLNPRLALALVPTPGLLGPDLAGEVKAVLPALRVRGNLCLFLEEVGVWGAHAALELFDCAATWGKDGVRPWFVSQYATGIPAPVRGQVSCCISGEQFKASDRDYLTRDFGRAFADSLHPCPPRTFRLAFTRSQYAAEHHQREREQRTKEQRR
ncbi:ATP-binding protein [Myxococcus sp. CA051A]|nr:ATP-binding protein [Myxococcus sp. CA051A]